MPATDPPRLLSKSRFAQGRICATRLYYAERPEYGNAAADDPLLAALADGGFQVGALARLQYPDGVLVAPLDVAEALRQTAELMQRDRVVIFEAALRAGPLLARVDILDKRGDEVALIEVKSKGFDPRRDRFLRARPGRGGQRLLGDWREYVADVGFQALVLRRAAPQLRVTPHLMFADRSRVATVDGLHQRFALRRGPRGSPEVVVRPGTDAEALGGPLLCRVDASAAVAALDHEGLAPGDSFAAQVDRLAAGYVADVRPEAPIGAHCASCPFRIDAILRAAGKRSGFEACWQAALGVPVEALRERPLVIDMGYLPHAELLAGGHAFVADLTEQQVRPQADGRPGMSLSERRWRRVTQLREGHTEGYLDRDGLSAAMAGWQFPLHMVDFETIAAALPFYAHDRPYEPIAFQFSHHTVGHDGAVAHAHEWIETAPGAYPNVAFVRALRAALGETGTIFRYSDHENTVLCQILRQIEAAAAPPADAAALADFIRSITRSPAAAEVPWEGPRAMVDLCALVRRFDLHPAAHGSASLKAVLPAALRASPALQRRYAAPVYGAVGGIASHNFVDWAWVRRDAHGDLLDPYQLLPPVAVVGPAAARLYGPDLLRDGAGAMAAYACMQFTEMATAERQALREALLRYCELDTLAMVMLYEGWRAALG